MRGSLNGNGSNSAFVLCKVAFSKLQRMSMTTSCRAVVLPRFGRPEVLELREDVNVPDLKPNEVLVRARAVSVNPLDCRMREGYAPSLFEPLLPLILGRDISGEVAAVGGDVRSFIVGQEVFGALHPTAVRGTYADYAILAENELTQKPESVSHVDASAIPFAALTAWHALRRTARIKERQRVLVVGGGGAVGFSAIQLAVAVGCHVCTTCEAESIDRILAVGAEQAVDYATKNYEVSINGYFDVVLDTIGRPETESMGINLLNNDGKYYVTLQGDSASFTDKYDLAIFLPVATAILPKRQLQYRDCQGIRYWWNSMRGGADGLKEIGQLTKIGKLRVPVQKTFPITEVRKAHEAKDMGLIPGKVVLQFD